MSRWVLVLSLGLGVTGCAAARTREALTTERLLAAAGFHSDPADTPAKLGDLQRLPSRKLVRDQRNGEPYYLYADPDVCRCVYSGNGQQYREYQKLKLQKELADERRRSLQDFLNPSFW